MKNKTLIKPVWVTADTHHTLIKIKAHKNHKNLDETIQYIIKEADGNLLKD